MKRLIANENILKNGFTNLDEILTQVSEESVIKALENHIEKFFNVKFFADYYFKPGDGTNNIKKLEFKKILPAIVDNVMFDGQILRNNNDFYKELLIDDEVPQNAKNSIFQEILDKYAKQLITNMTGTNCLAYRLSQKVTDYALIEHKDWFKREEKKDKKDINDYIRRDKQVPWSVVKNSDEPIGTKFHTKDLDFDNRDYPFIVLDKSLVIKGKKGQSHTQALHDFMEKHSDENESYEQASEHLQGGWKRYIAEDVIEDILQSDTVCFGHVKNKIAFVDTWENCSVEDVANLIQSELNVNKVYESTRLGNDFYNKRVARLIPKYNPKLQKMNFEFMKFYKKNRR